MNLLHRLSFPLVSISILSLSACVFTADDPDSKSSDPDVAAANFSKNVTINGATLQKGAPPASTGTFSGTTSDATATYGGSTNPMIIDLSGADFSGQDPSANSTINIAFNGSGSGASGAQSYFTIPANTGVLNDAISPAISTQFTVDPSVCNNLADIQHQIDCYESVTLPDGTTVSKDQAQQMILACDTGKFSGAGSYCAYNYPKDACDLVQESYPNTAFVPGVGPGTCDAFGNVDYKDDYEYYVEEEIGQVGACVLSY